MCKMFVVMKRNLGQVTVPMSKEDCELYIQGSTAKDKTVYEIVPVHPDFS